MAQKHCDWGTGSKTPYSDYFITTACSKQRVLVVNSHVRNFSWVSSQCWEQAPIICSPDFDQTIIWPLMPHKHFQRLCQIIYMCYMYITMRRYTVVLVKPRQLQMNKYLRTPSHHELARRTTSMGFHRGTTIGVWGSSHWVKDLDVYKTVASTLRFILRHNYHR